MTTTLAAVIIVLLAIAAAFYFKWFRISASNDQTNDKANVSFSVDKGKVKDDTAHAVSEVKKLGQKVSDATTSDSESGDNAKDGNRPHLSLSSKEIALDEGGQKNVTVTRTGGDLKELQLTLSPSSGSYLLATAGHFKVGETSTLIAVTAPQGAQDGSISIVTGNHAEVLAVHVNR